VAWPSSAGASAGCPGADSPPWLVGNEATEATTLCLLNEERAGHGIAPLTLDEQLSQSALRHSQDMVAKKYFEHDSLDGRSFLERILATGWQVPSWIVGENLAWGAGERATPAAIVQAWMNSPGHRVNVLDWTFRSIGMGIVQGVPVAFDGPGATYTTDFGGSTAVNGSGANSSKARAKRRRAQKRARMRRLRAAKRRQQKRRHAAGIRAGRAAF
jgi:uncharacterized protein YkwD